VARRAKMGPADAGGSKSNVSGSIIGIGRTIAALWSGTKAAICSLKPLSRHPNQVKPCVFFCRDLGTAKFSSGTPHQLSILGYRSWATQLVEALS
jgi:hypothetical protein